MQRRIRALESTQDESTQFSRHLIRSQEHERSRIAGELHDGLGHELQLIRNSAQMALNQSADDPRMMAHLNAISQTALRALEGVRAISKGLHPPELQHLGLSSALDQLARRVQQSFAGSVDSHVDNIDGLLDAERELDVFRIAQEALGNALKHSSATEITFEVQRHLRAIQISVFDNGSGFNTQLIGSGLGSGLGLVNMDKRAEWLGTRLKLRSERGKGTRITLDVPLSRETPSP
jgi:signal transduction histidine kinase